MLYNELSQTQIATLWHLLEYAQLNQLNELKKKHSEIISKRELEQYRNNVLEFIMLNQVDIEDLFYWLNTLKENNNNTIVNIEYSSINKKKGISITTINNKIKKLSSNIIDISPNNINGPVFSLVNTMKSNIELTLIVPAWKTKEEKQGFPITRHKKILLQEPSFYFIYIWFDVKQKTIILSLPSTKEYFSIWNINTKKNLPDLLTHKTLDFLEEILGEIELVSPKWVNKALRRITNEYFYHNNDNVEIELGKINDKKKALPPNKNNLLEDYFSSLSPILDNEVSIRRIKKSIDKIIENELISHFGLNPCHHPFEVFLQEVDKGDATFKSRNGSVNDKSRILPSLNTRDTILSILDSSSLKVIGLKYYSNNGKTVPYKFICKDKWFILEQTNETGTAKELVKNVLKEFKNYKGSEPLSFEGTK